MKLGKYVIIAAALGLSAPVLAQSSPATSTIPPSANETSGPSNANQKAQGSGSQDLNNNRSGTSNRAAGQAQSDRAKNRAADTGATSGAAGAHIGATSTNETSGNSPIPGVKPQGSGSGGAKGTANADDKTKNRKAAKSGSTAGGTGATGTSAGANIGATGTNETSGNSNAGNKAQGSGSGNAERTGAAERRSGGTGAPKY